MTKDRVCVWLGNIPLFPVDNLVNSLSFGQCQLLNEAVRLSEAGTLSDPERLNGVASLGGVERLCEAERPSPEPPAPPPRVGGGRAL